MTLYSNCCNAYDRLFRRVLDMNYSEMGICPNCGEHCGFVNDQFAKGLHKVTKAKKDLISITIQNALNDYCHVELFDYIRSQAKDNRQMMESVIGLELTAKILNA